MNPFLANVDFALEVATVTVTTNQITKADYLSSTTIVKKLVETQKKVSLYKPGNCKEHTAFIFNLNKPARDIFMYIMANIGENQDTIKLERDVVSKIIGISVNTYYSGIEDLKGNGVLAVEQRANFWVNPFLIFRGDRIAYYQEQCPDCIKNIVNVYTEK